MAYVQLRVLQYQVALCQNQNQNRTKYYYDQSIIKLVA